MTDTTASFYDVTPFNGRIAARGAYRRVVRGAAMGLGAVAATGVLITTVTLAAAWMLNTALSGNPHIYARTPMGPGTFALAGPAPSGASANFSAPPAVQVRLADADDTSFEARWSRVAGPAAVPVMAVAIAPPHQNEIAANVPLPPRRPVVPRQVARAVADTQVAKLEPAPASIPPLPPQRAPEKAAIVPLPRPSPAAQAAARSPLGQAATQIAALAPPPAPAPRVPPPHDSNKLAALPGPGSRTAVYDISAHTVYLPSGQKLEAHSGLGDKLDNPRYVNVRMRGPTPPNVYDLTLREQLFHGVRAIRLNPVDDGKMFGRDGMLAHTYMLGPNGQSNGCVSFRDYQKFLQAYLRGEVDRLVVVARLDHTPVPMAHRNRDDRYALNND
jgi:Tlde1 domain